MPRKDPEARKAYQAAWHKRNYVPSDKPYRRGDFSNQLRRKQSDYGLSIERFLEMVEAQDNCCAICGVHADNQKGSPRKVQALGVDHDHRCCPRTGRCCGKCVRGLLCTPCNQALGKFGDSISVLERAITYLAKYGVQE